MRNEQRACHSARGNNQAHLGIWGLGYWGANGEHTIYVEQIDNISAFIVGAAALRRDGQAQAPLSPCCSPLITWAEAAFEKQKFHSRLGAGAGMRGQESCLGVFETAGAGAGDGATRDEGRARPAEGGGEGGGGLLHAGSGSPWICSDAHSALALCTSLHC